MIQESENIIRSCFKHVNMFPIDGKFRTLSARAEKIFLRDEKSSIASSFLVYILLFKYFSIAFNAINKVSRRNKETKTKNWNMGVQYSLYFFFFLNQVSYLSTWHKIIGRVKKKFTPTWCHRYIKQITISLFWTIGIL